MSINSLLLTVVTVVLAAILAAGLYHQFGLEGFTSTPDQVVMEQGLYSLYNEVLNRAPTSNELRSNVKKLTAGKTSLSLIRQSMVDSDEYDRIIKMQSNSLVPELPKMLSDKRLIGTVAKLYKQERGTDIPPKRTLALKDVFILMGYNQPAYRIFLKHSQYQNFEDDLAATDNLTRDQMITIYMRYFGTQDLDADQLAADGVTTTSEAANNGATDVTDASGIMGVGTDDPFLSTDALDAGLDAATTTATPTPASCMSTTDMQAMIDYIMQQAKRNFDKDASAASLDTMRAAAGRQERVYLHTDDMVLRPEFSWSVPQFRPPVCTTIGQPPLVQPLLENSKLLLGTPLKDARHTSVGSIMPKFEHKEYVNVMA